MTQDYGPVEGFCEHGNEPSSSIKKAFCCLTSCVTISFSKNILQHGISKVLYLHFPNTPSGLGA
jgi:hypothetical protein